MCGSTNEETDLALRRYDVVMRYLASDNAIYWTRSQLLLVAEVALLGFFGNQVKDLPECLCHAPQYKLIALIADCLVGILLCVLWHFAIKGGQFWMDRWESILTGLEERAFGSDVTLYGGMTPTMRPKPRTRAVARWTVISFATVWVAALLLSLYLETSKVLAWR